MKNKEEISQKKKILFYIANYFVFRSGPIGYLYDVCQEFPTVFLSEKLDQETEKIIEDKIFFPKLEKIIPIKQFTGEKKNLFEKNLYLHGLAKKVLLEEKPDIIICSSDTHSLFELYLMRFAKKKEMKNKIKKNKILKITVQTGNVGDNKIIEKRVDLTNAYLRFPNFLPLFLRIFLVKIRKYLGHILYYWIFPVLVGEMPFFGKSSHILYKGNSGMRDSDFQTVFSKNDFDIFIKDGVSKEKLYIVSHPLQGESRRFFEIAFWGKKEISKNRKIITVLLPEDRIGFRRKDDSLISEENIFTVRKEILKLIAGILDDWIIYLKPHPDIVDLERFLNPFLGFGNNIIIADKNDPLDKYIEASDIILELPLAAGTALFTASLQCPEKTIISLDFHKEILGDYYKGSELIEYVDNWDDFSKLLLKIRDGKYQKKLNNAAQNEGFPGMSELLNSLLLQVKNP